MGRTVIIAAWLAFLLGSASAQENVLREVLPAPLTVERSSEPDWVQVDTSLGMMVVEASVNGETRSFVFDTGSPSMLTRRFADTLSLEIIGQNTGVDANGMPVTMDIAVVDEIVLGGTTFRNVPVLIHDFAKVPLGNCFFDGGVLGSELFPGSAWRISLVDQTIGIAASADGLGASEASLTAKLHDFGYPQAPVIDYRIGDLSDKALFDTGNAESFVLFERLLDNKSVQKQIDRGSVSVVDGSEGVSAGGRGEVRTLRRFAIDGVRVGDEELGRLEGVTRGAPPTLFGRGLLAAYDIILDYPRAEFLLVPQKGTNETGPDYAIGYVGDRAEVVQLTRRSPAARRGLRLGDEIAAINGRDMTTASGNSTCASAKWLLTDFDSRAEAELVVTRDGRQFAVTIPSADGQ